MKLTIIIDKKSQEYTCRPGTTPESILKNFEHTYPIYAARADGKVIRLNEPIGYTEKLEFLDLRDPSGNMTYQSSLKLLYLRAISDLYGNVKVVMENSLSQGIFTVIHTKKLDSDSAGKIEARMRELVEKKLPIIKYSMTREAFFNRFPDQKCFSDMKAIGSMNVYQLGQTESYFYNELVPDTSYLTLFDVRRYKKGMILRFPKPAAPLMVPEFSAQPLLYEAFAEEKLWEKLMGVNYIGDLNRRVMEHDIKDLVLLSEALHEKKIAAIAETIHRKHKRIILIAGPSSSGKTTFAKRLCIQLRVEGLKPLYLGTDDYFREREDSPKDADGKYDFEGLGALDLELFNQQMNDLLTGKKVDIPEYNFVKGKKEFGKRITSIRDDQPIVIEGLHCLNPELTGMIEDSEKFKIYISPLTQLNIDIHNRIPTTDARMLRRIVRDAKYRGTDAAKTISSWQSVRSGEDRNIFPFVDEADVFFNSQCLYELAVLKRYARPQLENISSQQPEYPEAQRMLKFLEFFAEIEDTSIVPNNSILREFIGGSVIA